MGKITLVTGGVRSGKSRFALSYAQSKDGNKMFIATAVPFDDEMKIRVDNHRRERGELFETVEEPYELAAAITSVDSRYSITVVDCLTVWMGNLFYKYEQNPGQIYTEIDRLVMALSRVQSEIIIVTNEVGWGIVPENKLAREFRDMNGLLNQKVAAVADNVILSVSGIQINIKGNGLQHVN
jgi:adenosylcobinamide kinase / adenosylcobinamide-phosphate guanylyltransferase